MSHIVNTNEDLLKMHDHLELLRQKNYSKDTIQEILEDIIPQNEIYQVKPEINSRGYPAYFSGYDQVIHINDCALHDYLIKMQETIIKMHPDLEKCKNDIFPYITLFVLFHEVEHVYQYLFGQEYILPSYQIIADAYKYLSDIQKYLMELKNNKKISTLKMEILIEKFKQEKDKSTFILERNANLDAHDLLTKLAEYEDNEKLRKYFENQYIWCKACGYINLKYNGSLEESYKKLWNYKLYKTFDFGEDIPLEDKIRYGLPIKNKERIVLLKKFVETEE